MASSIPICFHGWNSITPPWAIFTSVARAGSPKAGGPVWPIIPERRGESGARRATLIVLDGGEGEAGVRIEPVEIEEAGQYRTLAVPLGDDGQPLEHADARALVTSLAERFGPRDWVRLELEGFIEARAPAEALQRALERAAEGRFRAFEVGLDGLVEAELLRGHPLVRGFDAQWRRRHDQALADNDEQEAALLVRARRLALEAIRERLEAF